MIKHIKTRTKQSRGLENFWTPQTDLPVPQHPTCSIDVWFSKVAVRFWNWFWMPMIHPEIPRPPVYRLQVKRSIWFFWSTWAPELLLSVSIWRNVWGLERLGPHPGYRHMTKLIINLFCLFFLFISAGKFFVPIIRGTRDVDDVVDSVSTS